MSAWRPEWDEGAKKSSFGGGGMMGRGIGGGMVPFWTKRLLLANLAIFVLAFLLESSGAVGFTDALAVDSTWWWLHSPHLPVWQLVTYGFLHVDISHILFNSLSLFFFGSMLERAIGARKFLVFYLAALVIGGLLHTIIGQFGMFGGAVVGASGAVMACIVAAALLFPNNQVIFIVFPIPLWVMATGLVAIDLLSMTRYGTGVAHHVHIAGALFGFFFIKNGWYRTDFIGVIEGQRAAKVVKSAAQDAAKLDTLLERIGRDGMSSLSNSEKEFLKRMSKRP
jgi:membrane associated rhomboid family serine protease